MNIIRVFIREIYWAYHVIVTSFIWSFKSFKRGKSDSKSCLAGKTAIITGGNNGIGFGTSVLLASRGCRVIIACRSDASDVKTKIVEMTDNPNIVIKKLDLMSFRSVREFADDIRKNEPKIDILINNAGIGATDQKLTEDGINPVLQTNYFSHFLLTHLLSETLKSAGSARVIFLSSGLAYMNRLRLESLADTDSGNFFTDEFDVYSNSKTCGIIAGQIFAKKLMNYNIAVNVADPGVVRTDIIKRTENRYADIFSNLFISFVIRTYQRDIEDGAQTSFHLASSEKLKGVTGELFFRCERIIKPFVCYDNDFCMKVWKKSEEMVRLKSQELPRKPPFVY